MIVRKIQSEPLYQTVENVTLCSKLEMFKASNGWLQGFQSRHHIKSYNITGESGSVELGSVILSRERVSEVAAKYLPQNIYNCDETALYWKCIPDRTLARIGSKTLQGRKQPKDRVTVLLCCNLTGSDMRKPMVIGKYWAPRCFKDMDRGLLGADYHANQNAWMTGSLFSQWLRQFDQSLGERRILLIMDGAACHQLPTDLRNIEVVFLEPNTTSVCQPLDQGIIQMLKTLYRRKLLQNIVADIDNNEEDPGALDLKQAIQWLSTIWTTLKDAPAIGKCFQKANIFPDHFFKHLVKEDHEINVVLPDMASLSTLSLTETDLSEFFSFDDYYQTENIEASDEEIVSSTLNLVQSVEAEFDSSKSKEEEQPVFPEHIRCLNKILQYFSENATDLGIEARLMLELAEISKRAKRKHFREVAASLKQTKLSGFFTRNI